jgi:hypothetical protein
LTVEERLFGKRKGNCRTGKRGREGKRWCQYDQKYTIYMYENVIMKPIILNN